MEKKSKSKDKESKTRKTFDILKHTLVPKHRILSKEEKEKILKKFGISELQFPTIQSKDRVCKAIGAKPDDIIEITRIIPTGKSLHYRKVLQ